jgi:hypothetical protein
MSEQNDETAVIPEAPEPAATPTKPSWKDRVYGVRSVAVVAVAGLIIGGGAGAAIHAATDDGGRDGRMGFNRGPGGFGGPPGQMQGGPGQMQGGPGQMQGGPGGMPDGGPNGQPPNGFPQPPNGVPGQTDPTTPPNNDDDSDDDGTSGGQDS